MADKAAKAAQAGGKLLKNIVKPPWKITGPASTAEYQSALTPSTEYRKQSPASPAVRVSVPHADADKVFDIKYYTRDTRRNQELANGRQLVSYEYDPKAPDSALEALDLPPTAGTPFKWKNRHLKPLLDYDNSGYT